ncbi:HBS1-like protein isoform X2 [Amphibalanus amphitrite]|uniref:HBS1-like protein isoform X1 n=1 Tax=Amphibalanus amphitrite TaxID=1232801 RepID=UPI001C9029FC|nr:HBS1-like protein isoform X1 [Amphibalanus amphitrite]XP_043229135.1 HBS1-like protein isoform X2 [Amphibalanus amphitrite]
MSRHRNVRGMNYDDEYDGYYDVYGHSVDDEYTMSPSSVEREFTFDRSRQQNMDAFLRGAPSSIAEEQEAEDSDGSGGAGAHRGAARQDSCGPLVPDHLNSEQRARLLSCLDAVRDVVGETVSDHAIVRAVLRHDYDCAAALDAILSDAMAGMPGGRLSRRDSMERPPSERGDTSPVPPAAAGAAKGPPPGIPVPSPAQPIQAAQGGRRQPPPARVVVGFDERLAAQAEKDPPVADSAAEAAAPSAAPLPAEVRELRAAAGGRSSSTSPMSSRRQSPAPAADGATPAKTPARTRDARAEYDKERADSKQLINMVVIGHVDAGKSTLMGHLLYQLGCVNKKVMHKYETESKKIGKQSFKFAWVLDETGEERTRGITMDVAHFKFETPQKTVTLLDAPGHKDFIPNMITGAAAADVAVLVVNATKGEFETGFESGGQTREHAILVRSLGVSQLAIAVNKLDTVGWSQARFDEIRGRLGTFLRSVGFRESELRYVPCSGLTGENLTQPAQEAALTAWYSGPTLLQVIDSFPAPERAVDRPLRLFVQDVFKGQQQSALSMAGRIDAGMLQVADKVTVMPHGETATVKGISIDEMPVQSAFAGDHVTVTLSGVDPQSQTVGVVLCDPGQPVKVTTKVQARIVIFSIDLPITKGYQVVVHYQSVSEPATITRLVCQLHRSSGEVLKQKPRCLPGNSSADVIITFQRPVCVELYKDFRDYGRLMLRVAGHTVAAGLITEVK